MEIRQVKYFITLAEEKTFTKAAEKLFITQPTLSQQIRELEKSLGVGLVLRTNKGIQLTEAGAVFYEHACSLMKEFDKCRHSVDLFSNKNDGTIRFATVDIVETFFLVQFLYNFQQEHKDVKILFSTETHKEIVEQVRDNTIDIGLANIPTDIKPEGIVAEKVGQDTLVIAIPKATPFRRIESFYDPMMQEVFSKTGILWSGWWDEDKVFDVARKINRSGKFEICTEHAIVLTKALYNKSYMIMPEILLDILDTKNLFYTIPIPEPGYSVDISLIRNEANFNPYVITLFESAVEFYKKNNG